MFDLVAARAAGVLSAFTGNIRVAPYLDSKLCAAWYAGFDAEREWQDNQLALPMGKSEAYKPRINANGI